MQCWRSNSELQTCDPGINQLSKVPSLSSLCCSIVSWDFWPEILLKSPVYSPSSVSSLCFHILSLKFSFGWNMLCPPPFFPIYHKNTKDGQGWTWKLTERATALINSLWPQVTTWTISLNSWSWGQTEKGGGREQWNCERPANLFSKCELHLRGAQGPLCFYGGEDRIDSNTPLTVRLYEFTKPYTCITSTKVRLKKDLLPLNNWSCEYTQQHTAFQFKWKRKIWY